MCRFRWHLALSLKAILREWYRACRAGDLAAQFVTLHPNAGFVQFAQATIDSRVHRAVRKNLKRASGSTTVPMSRPAITTCASRQTPAAPDEPLPHGGHRGDRRDGLRNLRREELSPESTCPSDAARSPADCGDPEQLRVGARNELINSNSSPDHAGVERKYATAR